MYFKGEFETANLLEFTSATGALESTTKRNGDYGGKNTNGTYFRKDVGAQYATLYISGYFRWDGDVGNDWNVIVGEGAASNQFSLKTLTGGKLKLQFNSLTYNGTKTLVKDTWYYIELRIYVHDTIGWIHVLVDETTDILVENADTKTGTDTGVRYVKWHGTDSAGVNCYVDRLTAADYIPYGIKIAKIGHNVRYCADKDLVMSSEFNMLKTKLVGSTTGSVAHGLAYVPIYFAMSKISSTKWGIVGQNYHSTLPYCDSTNFVSNGGGVKESKYYIFYQQGA